MGSINLVSCTKQNFYFYTCFAGSIVSKLNAIGETVDTNETLTYVIPQLINIENGTNVILQYILDSLTTEEDIVSQENVSGPVTAEEQELAINSILDVSIGEEGKLYLSYFICKVQWWP